MTQAKRPAKRRKVIPSNVALFPPLPHIPPAPRLATDPRQAQTRRVLGGIARVAETKMRLAGPNLATGFHASAVDLGRLQTALSRGIARLDMPQVKERRDEIREWLLHVLRAWVQRYKSVKIDRRANGIRVEIETQDDYGYYHYGFDVFPGRGQGPTTNESAQ